MYFSDSSYYKHIKCFKFSYKIRDINGNINVNNNIIYIFELFDYCQSLRNSQNFNN